MSVSFALILFGSLLIIAGWQNKSLSALARGDSTQPKGSGTASGAGASTTPNGRAVTATGHPDEGTRGAGH